MGLRIAAVLTVRGKGKCCLGAVAEGTVAAAVVAVVAVVVGVAARTCLRGIGRTAVVAEVALTDVLLV
jgi:hypothetical protein